MKFFKKWVRRKKIKRKIAERKMTVNLALVRCTECEKYNLGIEIYQQFQWPSHSGSAIRWDKETEQILVNEHALMRIIQIANPAQKKRRIKLVSQDEFYGKKI